MQEELKKLFQKTFKKRCEKIVALRAHASPRKIFRLSAGATTAIGVSHSDLAENRAFIGFARHFKKLGLPVPGIYAEKAKAGLYLTEDLGDTTLLDLLSRDRAKGSRLSSEVKGHYETVLRYLVKFQVAGLKNFPWKFCVNSAQYDSRAMHWDLNFFKYNFLQISGIAFDEVALERDFEALVNSLAGERSSYFLYRDFQSRNIMLREGKLFFIDFQGGRKGPLQYDLAALLYQGKAGLSEGERAQFLKSYLKELSAVKVKVNPKHFAQKFYGFALLFLLKVLGTYGLQGIANGKRYFIEGIPLAISNAKTLLAQKKNGLELPEIRRVVTELENWFKAYTRSSAKNLTVELRSFAYPSGVPKDLSGNGGGFVFDCRSVPNPGREAKFKAMTGRDAEVKKWLEREKVVAEFYRAARALVLNAVRNYKTRGFKHLFIAFGCTGGQHRSVYFAERLAAELKKDKEIKIELKHLEHPAER